MQVTLFVFMSAIIYYLAIECSGNLGLSVR